MAIGDGPDDRMLRTAWVSFCERLRAAGDLAFKDANPASPLHRADAFRFLTQNLGQAFDLALETRDTRYPELHAFCTPHRKLGGDAADLSYQQAWIDGKSVYRISGTLGTARFFNITVQGPRPETQPGTDWPSLHDPFGDIPEANIFGHQITADVNGHFELYVGGPEREPNWLPTTPGSRKLFIRQGFDGWDETPTRMRIERVGMDTPRPMPTPGDMAHAMGWAGKFVHDVMTDWPDHPYHYSGGAVDPVNVNAFPPEPENDTASDAKRGRAVANMVWHLARDEALIIEFDSHDDFWMVSLGGVFMNSFDYLYRHVSYTPGRTQLDGDGKVRLILAHEDPGYLNWLDSQGFDSGNLTYRRLMSQTRTDLTTRLVRWADLASALPPECPKAGPDFRQQQLIARFRGIQAQRYGL